MVAWLISQYNLPNGNNPSNNAIQEAIWTLMDPSIYNTGSPTKPLINPSGQDPTAELQAAATWFMGGGATNAFLSNFRIVSDFNMVPGSVASGGVGVGGFQEQIVMTPEPREVAVMLIGLLGVCGALARRARPLNSPEA